MRRLLLAATVSALSWACASTPAIPKDGAAPSAMSLYARGNAEYEAGKYAACAATFDAALALASDNRQRENFAYSGACCHALAGDAQAAFTRLEQAVDAGFRDAAHLQKDSDLGALRTDARWAPLVASVQAAEARYLASVNAELKSLFDADQADRQGNIAWDVVGPRDTQRRERVLQILEAGGARVSDDWFHAAMVFQHGKTAEDYTRAHQYAAKALELQPDHGRAKWLFAASKDRLLMVQGKPQLYGTQFTHKDGRWVLHPVDPSVTDEERARYNVPPLADQQAQAERMNAQAH